MKKTLPNIHAGEVLLEEFLKPMEISQNALGRTVGVSPRCRGEPNAVAAR